MSSEVEILPSTQKYEYRLPEKRKAVSIGYHHKFDQFFRRKAHMINCFSPILSAAVRPSTYKNKSSAETECASVALRPRLGDLLQTSPKQKEQLIQLEKIKMFLQPFTTPVGRAGLEIVNDIVEQHLVQVVRCTAHDTIRQHLAIERNPPVTSEERYAALAETNAHVYAKEISVPKAKKERFKTTCMTCGQQMSAQFFTRHLARCIKK